MITRRCGSTPEIIRPGHNGFIADSVGELVTAVQRVAGLSREACRRDFEERFSIGRMADNYERLYERLIAQIARRDHGDRVSAAGMAEEAGVEIAKAAALSAGTESG